MDFKAFRKAIERVQCSKWTPRQKRLDAYARALNGNLYDHLGYAFSQERKDQMMTTRILLDDRRAAVQDRLPMELVRDAVGMLFGEAHRPLILAPKDEGTTDWISAFIKDTDFWLRMIDAAWQGSVGSCCVVLRVLGDFQEDADGKTIIDAAGKPKPKGPGRFYFEIWPTVECSPIFKRSRPDELASLDRVYFIGEDSLRADGYNVDALRTEWEAKKLNGFKNGAKDARNGKFGGEDWVLRITLNDKEEVRFKPVPRWVYERTDFKPASDWVKDASRSFTHDLGEVPAEWARPMPVNAQALFPDGECFFDPVIDFQLRIDRTLSQTGRAFDYAGDPQMARLHGEGKASGSFGGADLSEPTAVGGTASDMLDIYGKGGDIKFVEITGDGLSVAIETYVKTLRDIAREAGAMSRITPDAKALTQLSAVAMKMLNFSQLVLVGILRLTCGEGLAVRLLRKAMRMDAKVNVELPSLEKSTTRPNPKAPIDVQWPDYYELHGQDKLYEVQAISAAKEGGLIGNATAVDNAAPMFDVQSATDELKNIESDQMDAMNNEVTKTAAIAKVDGSLMKAGDPPKN